MVVNRTCSMKEWQALRKPELQEEASESEADADITEALRMDLINLTAQGIYENSGCAMNEDICVDDAARLALEVTEKELSTVDVSRRSSPDPEHARLSVQDDMLNSTQGSTMGTLPSLRLSLADAHLGLLNTAAGASRFTFQDFAPRLFASIRQTDGIDTDTYQGSFCLEETTDEDLLREKFSEGKSGMFLYFTKDTKYMVKQMCPEDLQSLLQILPDYHNYVKANPGSTLMRFYGCHAITIPLSRTKIYFCVASNINATPIPAMHEKYDLKGSTVSRQFLTEEQIAVSTPHSEWFKNTLKDMDLVKLGRSMVLGTDIATRLKQQLQADSAFLEAQNIMDYSILLGIHRLGSTHMLPAELQSQGNERCLNPLVGSAQIALDVDVELQHCLAAGFRSADEAAVYSIGIIDILQKWNCDKLKENCCKRYALCKSDGISAVPPSAYQERFMKFVDAHLITRITDL